MSRKEDINQLVEEKLPIFTEVSDKIWGYAELCYEEAVSYTHLDVYKRQE